MNRALFLFTCFMLLSSRNYAQLTLLAHLPDKLNENSGLAVIDSTSVWIIEDGGNEDKIYEVDLQGNIKRDFQVKHAKNVDWEDLASDPEGTLYIPDTGNNNLKREEHVIYKLYHPVSEAGDKIPAEEIHYHYPPVHTNRSGPKYARHDAEALFYKDGSLYIVTKDRARPFTGVAFIYKVPAHKGNYEARLVGKFTPCRERGVCEITAADLSPDGDTLVLLSNGTLWIFSDFTGDHFTEGALKAINLGITTQLEAVVFLNKHTLLLSDEKQGDTGGNIYRFSLD